MSDPCPVRLSEVVLFCSPQVPPIPALRCQILLAVIGSLVSLATCQSTILSSLPSAVDAGDFATPPELVASPPLAGLSDGVPEPGVERRLGQEANGDPTPVADMSRRAVFAKARRLIRTWKKAQKATRPTGKWRVLGPVEHDPSGYIAALAVKTVGAGPACRHVYYALEVTLLRETDTSPTPPALLPPRMLGKDCCAPGPCKRSAVEWQIHQYRVVSARDKAAIDALLPPGGVEVRYHEDPSELGDDDDPPAKPLRTKRLGRAKLLAERLLERETDLLGWTPRCVSRRSATVCALPYPQAPELHWRDGRIVAIDAMAD